jgi:hypothetical protein
MAVKRYNGTSWDTVAGLGAQGAAATSSSITTWVKTAAGGETSLTGSSDSSTTLAYTPGQEQFFINGVLQVRGSDYTATNGTSITGLAALTAGDIATVTTVNAFSVTGAVPLSTVTANGDLIVGTSSGAVGRLGVGSTGNVLTVSGGVPTWATPATAQVPILTVSKYASNSTINTTSFADVTGYSITRTPVSGTNKIEIKLSIVVTTSTGIVSKWKLLQDATSLGEMAAYLNYDGAEPKILTFIWSTTNVAASSTVFKLQGAANTGSITVYGTNSGYNSTFSTMEVY